MASLWQFFGLPNPENPSVEKKGKKANSAPASMQKQPSLSQEEAPKAIEIEETTPLAPANEEPSQSQSGLLAKSVMKSAPPLWKGPLTAENEPFHDLGSHSKMKSSFPRRALRYVSPDEMNRIPTRDMAKRIHQGGFHNR